LWGKATGSQTINSSYASSVAAFLHLLYKYLQVIEKFLTSAPTTSQEATTISQLLTPTPTMTQLPEVQLAEHIPVTQDDPDVPKTRKAFVPLGSSPSQSCSRLF
jgi:hypothetical protein